MSAPPQTPLDVPLQAVVLAKAPVAGRVKTRLGAEIGMDRSASLAAAALADSLRACAEAVGPEHCHLALDGDLAEAVDAPLLQELVAGWSTRPQVDGELGARIAHAVGEVPGPLLQIGMDTPQVDAALLGRVGALLTQHDAVLGEADDGGWWVLALREPARAACLDGVPMSTGTTYLDTLAALRAEGLDVAACEVLRDVDTVFDAELVAATAPRTAFAERWRSGPEQREVVS